MTNELATQGAGPLAKPRGASLQSGYDQKDILWPRVMLLQFTPPKSVDIPMDIFKPGKIVNSITLAEMPKTFVPIAVRTKWIRFNAQEKSKPGYDPSYELGAKMWESEDPLDPRVQKEGAWGSNGESPLATKILEFFCLFEGEDLPVLLSFSKTSFTAGQRLLTMAQMGSEMYSFKYTLASKLEKNKQDQNFYILTVMNAGKTDEATFDRCQAIFEFYSRRAKDIKVHGEDTVEEAAAPATEGRPF